MTDKNPYIRTADKLEIGERNSIQGFTDEYMASVFIEKGCLPESDIRLIRKGPAGKALFVKINGTYFALRPEEAKTIILKF